MARWRESEAVYRAAELFRERCLSKRTSFLWPEREVWNGENLSLMWEAFVDSPDEGQRTFFEKWQDQLANEPEDVHRIAADMLAFYYLFPTNIGFDTKMSNLKRVLSWKLADDSPNLDLVEDAFGAGVGTGGMLYNTKIPWQMIFYLQFFGEVLSNGLNPHDVEVCRRLADEVRSKIKSSNPAYNILLHLFFPERFERTAADIHKHRIVEAFRDMSGEMENTDMALEEIRAALVEEYGRDDLDFYDEDVRFRWDGLKGGVATTNNGAVKETPTTEEYVAAFRATEGLPGRYLKMLQVQYGRPRRAVSSRQLSHAMGYADYGAANLHYGTLGRLIGEALDWNPDRGWKVLATGERPEGKEFNWVMRPEVAEALEELEWTKTSDAPSSSSGRTALSENLNTILFGPPGTGKTHTVQRKAVEVIEPSAASLSDREIAEKFRSYRKDGRIEFVTFHPSFSYEEFVEGFRYDEDKGIPTLHNGVFKEISEEARKNSEKPYVLVIDEINRGNISRIFGELITLLETDKRRGAANELSVKLPYSQEDFSVPGNLSVIGTMNTADRSIALLDVALRRRFEFEEMMPDVKVLENAGISETVCEVFEVLNARITALLDRDHQLGHSYFLSATSPELLHHALYKRIFPLLQEYFYNDMEQLKQVLGDYSELEGEKQGFVGESPLKGKLGAGFETDHLWEFHVYETDEIEGVLERTFIEG